MAEAAEKLVVVDKRRPMTGEGMATLAIRDAVALAEPVLDLKTNALKDDTVGVPLGDRVTVKRIPEAELSGRGIVIPQTGKQPASFGVVVGVGQGRYNLMGQLCPIRVKPGAVVMFGKYAGSDLPIFGVAHAAAEPLVCLREEEIMLVLMPREEYEAMQAATPDPAITGVSTK